MQPAPPPFARLAGHPLRWQLLRELARSDLRVRELVMAAGQPQNLVSRHAPGRRAARILLASGPAAGACWGAALISSRAWTWPVPAAARIAFGAALLLVVAALADAATGQHSYRRTRLAVPGSIGLIILDTAMIAAALLAAPAFTWALAAATAASLTRSGLAARLIPRAVTR